MQKSEIKFSLSPSLICPNCFSLYLLTRRLCLKFCSSVFFYTHFSDMIIDQRFIAACHLEEWNQINDHSFVGGIATPRHISPSEV